MKRFLIYDDEFSQCLELKDLLYKYSESENIHIDIAISHTEAEYLLIRNEYDIVFIDIKLDNEINGISFATDFNISSITSLVYITSHIRYCEEIFTTSPDAFILKPFNEERIKRTMEIIRKKKSSHYFLNIKNGKSSIERVDIGGVSYIENISRKLTFFDNEYNIIYEFYGIKISDIENRLPDYFIRCHHSICVNMKCVKSIGRYFFVMNDGREINISQTKFKNVRLKYMEFLGDLI